MARQADPETHPGPLAAWMAPFAGCFTRPTWANMLVLVAGALLSPGRRTVAAALSSVGLRGAATFTNYHRVLNRSRWSGQDAVRCLLGLLVAAFAPSGPVVVGIDETIERRWGAKIKARGIYGVVQNPAFLGYTRRAETAGLAGAGFRLEGCPVREAASRPGSNSLGLKRSQAQQGKPVRMAVAGHQLARALALALGMPAAQEAAVVEEEPEQVQV